jgi:thymidylate kinase/DNA-binding HxlR family transcriptional regulator
MLQARPLYDNAADARYFIEPSIWETAVRAIERQLNVLVTGERRIGKTSLLRQIQGNLRSRGENVVFVDATGTDSALELVGRIRDALSPASRSSPLEQQIAAVAGASRTLQTDLSAIGQADPAIVLVDASSSGHAVYDVFGRLRDTLWQFEHLWVVAIDDDDRATALRPPADSFFDVVVRVDGLPAEQLTELLRLRSPETPTATLSRVAENADGNPGRAIRALAEAYARGTDPADALAGRARMEAQASRLGRPHGMLFAELLERGQASASDAGLQRSLGLSRARLNQLLRELLEQDLVVQDVELPSGPGRPRTSYRPALP